MIFEVLRRNLAPILSYLYLWWMSPFVFLKKSYFLNYANTVYMCFWNLTSRWPMVSNAEIYIGTDTLFLLVNKLHNRIAILNQVHIHSSCRWRNARAHTHVQTHTHTKISFLWSVEKIVRSVLYLDSSLHFIVYRNWIS